MSLELLKEHLTYDRTDGEFFWAHAAPGRVLDKPVGFIESNGYRRVRLLNKKYHVHRLAWLWNHGEFPGEGYEIDHMNGHKADNRIENLRIVTKKGNAANRGPRSLGRVPGRGLQRGPSGHIGVLQGPRPSEWSYCLRFTVKGPFASPEEAAKAYDQDAVMVYGRYARTNYPLT